MIQRIQSLYLLLAAALTGMMLPFPYAVLQAADNSILFNVRAVQSIHPDAQITVLYHTLPVLLLVSVSGILQFCNIFLFKRRLLQMRICLLSALLLGGLIILMYYYYSMVKVEFSGMQFVLRMPALFPLLCIALDLLAFRSVRHDERMVTSADRLR